MTSRAHLSGLLERALAGVGRSLQDLHLNESSDGNHWHESEHEQRQLPAVDEADDDAGAQRRQAHDHRADARTCRSVHRRRVSRQTRAQRARAVLVIVKVCNFLQYAHNKIQSNRIQQKKSKPHKIPTKPIHVFLQEILRNKLKRTCLR